MVRTKARRKTGRRRRATSTPPAPPNPLMESKGPRPNRPRRPDPDTYDIHRLNADSLACSFGYRIGDFIHNTIPHPHRTDGPIYGRVIRITREALIIHRANADQSPQVDVQGGPMIDFVMKAAAKLIARADALGKVSKVNIRDFLDDPKKLAALKRDDSFVYVNTAYLGFPASPLANPYAVKTTPDKQAQAKIEAKAAYEKQVIAPAMASEYGPTWDELSSLADRVLNTENITIGCWCAEGDPCHGTTVISAVLAIASNRQGKEEQV